MCLQPQWVLPGLLFARRLSHSVAGTAGGILDSATCSLGCVPDCVCDAFGSVSGRLADTSDCMSC